MRTRFLAPLAAAVLLLAAAPVAAQPAIAPSHRAAAEELLEAAKVRLAFESSMELMLTSQVRQNPQMAELEPVMRQFFARYLAWDQLRDEYVRIYATRFTEAELREITAFYRTPAGQRMAEETPALAAAGAELGEQAVQRHLPELQRMVMEHLTGGTQ